MKEIFLDATVLVLAAGDSDPRRQACQDVFAAIRDGRARGHASTEAIQEFVLHRMRRGDGRAVALGREAASSCVLHPFDEHVLEATLLLMESGTVRGRDAVHAATAIRVGFSEIVTTDRDFDDVPGLSRLDPSFWTS